MTGIAGRLRAAALAAGQALSSSPARPGVELVRVDQPQPPPAPPPLALPAPAWPVCPRCRSRHEPRPLPGRSGNRGGGLSAYREMRVLPDPTRPQPLSQGHDVDDTALALRRFRPWTGL